MSTLMRKEIFEQPEAISKTIHDFSKLEKKLAQIDVSRIKKIVFIARGTSDNVAAYGIFLIPIVSGIEAYSLSPSLLNSYDVELDLSESLVIAISQSGETQEIVTAAKRAKALGAKVISITNNENSSLESASDLCLVTPAGKEFAVPATKTYTTALAGLALIVSELFQNEKLKNLIGELPEILKKQIETNHVDSEVVKILAESATAVFAGRGLAMGATFEAALKLKETCEINVIGTSVADFVHGPIAALNKNVPLVILSADRESSIYPGLTDLITRAKATGCPIVTFGDFHDSEKSANHLSIDLGSGYELVAPIILAVPSQTLAANVSDAKGLNADAPRVLNKVTQTA